MKKSADDFEITLELSKRLAERLDKLSQIKERSVEWLIKTAIEKYLQCEEERERLRQETFQKWEKPEFEDMKKKKDPENK